MRRIRLVMVGISIFVCPFVAGDVLAENGFFERWSPSRFLRDSQDSQIPESRLQTIRAKLEARGIPIATIDQRIAERSKLPVTNPVLVSKNHPLGNGEAGGKTASTPNAAADTGNLSSVIRENGFSGARNAWLNDRPIDKIVRADGDVRQTGNAQDSLSSMPLDWHPVFPVTTLTRDGAQAQAGTDAPRAGFDHFRRSRGRR